MMRPIRRAVHSLFPNQLRLLVIIFAITLIGCPSPTDWSVYEGVNLIRQRDFDQWQAIHEGKYVTLEPADTADYPDVEGRISGQAYRLELINLIPDGDFESATPGLLRDHSTHWSEEGTTNAAVITADTYNSSDDADGVDLTPLHGNQVLRVDYEDTTARLYLDLRNKLTVDGAFETGAQFAFFLDFRITYSSFPVALNSGRELETDHQNQYSIERGGDQESEDQKSTVSYRFPGTDQANPAQFDPDTNTLTVRPEDGDPIYHRFSLGGDTAQASARTDAIIDNVRLTRNDLTHAITLDVPLADASQPERPEILSGGTYELRFFVGRDLSVTGTPNRFDARYLTVGVESAATPGPDSLLSKNISLEALDQWGSNAEDAGWTEIRYEFKGPTMLSNTESDDPVMRINIAFGQDKSPAARYLYPGSLMVAAPNLRLLTP